MKKLIIKEEFIFDTAPFAECHASSLAETPQGIVATWFGGTKEKHEDVGIWCARQNASRWTEPIEVVNSLWHDGKRYPCWNPVLFQPKSGALFLFYKVGPDPKTWWGMVMASDDDGQTWSPSERLAEGILGAIKNKPIELENGDLLAPSSDETNGWTVHMERSGDQGQTWTRTKPLNDPHVFDAIQPTILKHRDGHLQALCRTKQAIITELWSEDNGHSWTEMKATHLPNNNSGFDAVTLEDGRHVLIYNHVATPEGEWGGARTPLNVAISDDGKTWEDVMVLEDEAGEYSYPAIIQSADGRIHMSYTWKRKKIKHVVLELL